MPVLTPFATDGFSVNGTNFLFWQSKDPQTNIMWDVFRKVGAGAYSLLGTVNPVATTRGINAGFSMAETCYEDATAVKGTNYIYRVQGRLSPGDVSAFSPEYQIDSKGTEYFLGGAGANNSNNGLSAGTSWATFAKAATTIPGNAGNVLTVLSNQSQSGHHVFNDNVSIRGANPNAKVQITDLNKYNPEWWDETKALFLWGTTYQAGYTRLRADCLVENIDFVSNNQNFNFNTRDFNAPRRAWSPLYVRRRKNVVIRNVNAKDFFRSAVSLHGLSQNVWVKNTVFTDCGQDEGAFATGGIHGKGDVENMWYQDSIVDHKLKGYAVKLQKGYEQPGGYDVTDHVTNIHYQRLVMNGKWGSSFNSNGNISIEHWNIRNRGVEVSDCFFDVSYSFDTDNQILDGWAYTVFQHHTTYKILKELTGENASSFMIMEDCWIDFRDNTNAWGGLGEYNGGPTIYSQKWRRILFDLGIRGTSLFVYTCDIRDLEIDNCYIRQEASPNGPTTLLEFRGTKTNGERTGYKVRNCVFDTGQAVRSIRTIEGSTATVNNAVFKNNTYNLLPTGFTFTPDASNVLATAQVRRGNSRLTSAEATSFITPETVSNLLDNGLDVGMAFSGALPDRGAVEVGTSVQQPVFANITPPPATLILGGSFNMNYAVTATGGTVTLVELMRDNVAVQTDNAAPFDAFAITGLAVGTYTFRLRATDSNGRVGNSQNYNVAVRAANTPPTVSLSPLNTSYPTGGMVLLEAVAADSDGTVVKVEFFAGATKLGEKTAAPWTFNWVPATGSYNLTARATDNDGAANTSAARSVTVAPQQSGPFVARNIGGQQGQAAAITVGGRQFTAMLASAVKAGANWGNPSPGNPVFNPATDAATEAMLRTFVYGTPGTPVVIEETVPNGQYNVWVWAMEDNGPSAFDLTVQGVKVRDNHLLRGTGAAGTWERMGPFAAAVTNGILRIEGSDGDMNMAGYEIDSVGGTVSLTLSTSAGSVVAGQPVTLAASPALPAGVSVTKVEFFDGIVKIGEDLAAPYSLVWNPAAGIRSVTARLTDNGSNVYISNAVNVTVAAGNTPPSGTLTGPATAVSRGTATFAVALADDAGVASMRLMRREGQTEITIAQRDLTTNPVTGSQNIAWTDVPVGQWNVFMRLTDTGGLSADTNTVAINVTQDVRRGENWGYILQDDGTRLFVISRQ